MENMYMDVHDNMLKMAMKDAYNQQDLAEKAKLQVDLFQKAQEYAKEVGMQEVKAKQFANQLNDSTKKAQYARAMMFQSASQVRMLIDQTVKNLQPIQCNGPNCKVEPQMMIPEDFTKLGDFNNFIFKEKNLRGN
jgi:hypothetical protein